MRRPSIKIGQRDRLRPLTRPKDMVLAADNQDAREIFAFMSETVHKAYTQLMFENKQIRQLPDFDRHITNRFVQ